MAAAELTRRGWHIREESVETLAEEGKIPADVIVNKILNIDLKEIGAAWLNEDINRSKLDYVVGPAVLQLQKLRVVSAPKENEDSQAAPKLCRLSLTDGHVTCSAVTLEPVQGIGVNTPPGTKVLLSGTIEVETSFLLLTSKNFRSLGGRVETLAEPWELKKTLAKQSLTRARGEGGPPPFVPFGKKIGKDPLPSLHKDNFKSLSAGKEKKTTEGDSEFEQLRQAEIKQALQAKSTSGGVRTFGGGNKAQINDKDVARIIEMGFSAEEATSALKSSAGNVQDAINFLLSGGIRNQRSGERGGFRGGGGRGGGEGGRRGRREREYEDDGEGPINTRPSGPATLFDFLETKIPTKEETKNTPKTSSSDFKNPAPNSFSSNYSSPRDKLYHDTPRSSTQFQSHNSTQDSHQNQHCSYRDGVRRDNYGAGGRGGGVGNRQNSSETSRGGRGYNNTGYGQQQQDLPPRFAKSGQQRGGNQYDRDGGGSGHYGRDMEQRGDRRGQVRDQEGYRGNSGNPRISDRYDRDGQRGAGRGQRQYDENNDFRDQGRRNMDGGPGGYKRQDLNDRPGAYPGPRHRPPLAENVSPGDGPIFIRPKSSAYNSGDNSGDNASNQYYGGESSSQPRGYQQDHRPGSSKQAEEDSFEKRRGGYPNPNRGDGQAREQNAPPRNRNSSQNFASRDPQHYPDHRGGGGAQPWLNKRPDHYSNKPYQEPLLSTPPYHQDSLPYRDHQMAPNGGPPIASIGDTVLAKYWEDQKYYRAVVENVYQAGNTVVVTFIEYGNQEEVFIGDLLPISQPGWTFQMPPHMYDMGGVDPSMQDRGYSTSPAYVPPMEFTRGGGNYQRGGGGPGAPRRRPDDRKKPTQKYYVAPNQKTN